MLKRVITDKDIINSLIYDNDSEKKVKGTDLVLSKIHPADNPKVLIIGTFNNDSDMYSYPSHLSFCDELPAYPEDGKTTLWAVSFKDEGGDAKKGLTFLFSERKACCKFAILQVDIDLHTKFLETGKNEAGDEIPLALYTKDADEEGVITAPDFDDSFGGD